MTAALRLATRILHDLYLHAAEPGHPLRAQALADRWGVSRSPINDALALLHARGLIEHAAGKGYSAGPGFARRAGAGTHADHGADQDAHWAALCRQLDPSGTGTPPSLMDLCRAIADDRRAGILPDTFSEAQLQSRYHLTRGRLATLLGVLAHDGWADRKSGQGWTFSPLLTSPDTLLQASRSRMLLEPAALREPGYRLAPDALARCRIAEQRILDLDHPATQSSCLATPWSGNDLHDRGVHFHHTLAAASRNRFLIDALDRIHRLRTVLPHGAIQDRERTRRQAAEHLAILVEIEHGRLTAAAALMRQHLRTAHEHLEQSLALTRFRQPAPAPQAAR